MYFQYLVPVINTMPKKVVAIILLLPLFVIKNGFAQRGSLVVNVKEMGAAADGEKDDTQILRRALDSAAQAGGGTVYLPEGSYKITGALHINFHSEKTIKIVGENAVIYPTKLFYYFYSNNTKKKPHPFGEIEVTGVTIDGSRLPHPQKHYYDNPWCAYGMFFTNVRAIHIHDCTFKNIYGTAIKLVLHQVNRELKNTSVSIHDNKIKDTWGFNPTKDYINKKKPEQAAYDNYGDGIAIWGYSDAIIRDNYIYNDVKNTRFFGRCGIAVENFSENTLIERNTIYGYDRNIHLEMDRGGHLILDNKIGGSDIALYLWLTKTYDGRYPNNPIVFKNNKIYYDGEIQKYNLKPFMGPRVFIAFRGNQANEIYQNSVVKGNTFTHSDGTSENTLADQSNHKLIRVPPGMKIIMKRNKANR